MPYSHTKRCIFIHIPKTAGTSIEMFLREGGLNDLEMVGVRKGRSLQHLLGIYLKKNLKFWNDYYRFSIVRNPYDRFLSDYYWCRIPGVGYKGGQTIDQFLDYVIDVVTNNKFYTNIFHDHFIPQHLFIIWKDRLLVHHVFKYENLDYVVDFLKRKLRIKGNLPHTQQTGEKPYQLTDEHKEKIYALYYIDFKRFGYDK